jgi:CubicO group peptidase (beta-lactamase class C family)
VENGLSTLLQIRGRAADRFTIGERMEHYGVPGVSVAVVDDGAVAWAGGYGVADAETGEPVTPETLFQAASISKPVAAVAALALVEEGTLALDAPVNDRLREWRIPENDFTRTRAVTLRHLLTHTGGLTVHGFPGYAATEEVPTTVQVLDGSGPANTGPVRVDTVPGSIWRYSGGGYTIVQKLLTDVTGRSFPDLMRELVLDPVGMTASSYRQPLPPERERGAASGHLEDGSRVEGEWHVYPEMAAAGLWTNPTELARLALALQAAWRGESDVPLSGETARAMLTPGQGDWGLGFSVQDGEFPRFSHGGSNHGFKAQFLASVEDGRGVFVMTNGERGTPLAMEIVQAVARAYGWPAPVSRKVDVVDLDEDLLSRVAGSYLMEGMDLEISIAARDDHLAVEVGTAPAERYFPLSETEFINLETGDRFQVVTDEDGAVAALEVRGGARALPVR